MQAHVHLVGDIAEIAPAARRAAVVDLEILHDAGGVDLDTLGVLSPDVENRAGFRIHHVDPSQWQRISERICSLENGSVTRP